MVRVSELSCRNEFWWSCLKEENCLYLVFLKQGLHHAIPSVLYIWDKNEKKIDVIWVLLGMYAGE